VRASGLVTPGYTFLWQSWLLPRQIPRLVLIWDPHGPDLICWLRLAVHIVPSASRAADAVNFEVAPPKAMNAVGEVPDPPTSTFLTGTFNPLSKSRELHHNLGGVGLLGKFLRWGYWADVQDVQHSEDVAFRYPMIYAGTESIPYGLDL
jgi:hypothetical protein